MMDDSFISESQQGATPMAQDVSEQISAALAEVSSAMTCLSQELTNCAKEHPSSNTELQVLRKKEMMF